MFVGPDALDTPLTFEGTRAINASLGSGVVMVFDETATWSARCAGSPRSSATSRAASACPAASGPCARRSCWRGSRTAWSVRSREEELVLLADIGRAMRDASICGLGQTASSAIESAMRQPELVAL